jgi:uncharacterized RDD family membrane protein YckC
LQVTDTISAASALEPAPLGVRIVAAIIDIVATMVLLYVIALLTGQTTEDGFELTGGPLLLSALVTVLYYIVLEAQLGATLGKMAVGLRVLQEGGGRIEWKDSIVRNILRIVDGLPAFYLLGLIVARASPRRQRIGDRVAGTIVVRAARGAPAATATRPM